LSRQLRSAYEKLTEWPEEPVKPPLIHQETICGAHGDQGRQSIRRPGSGYRISTFTGHRAELLRTSDQGQFQRHKWQWPIFQGLKLRTVSEVLNPSEGSIKACLFRATQELYFQLAGFTIGKEIFDEATLR
jgi:hypothetical protein